MGSLPLGGRPGPTQGPEQVTPSSYMEVSYADNACVSIRSKVKGQGGGDGRREAWSGMRVRVCGWVEETCLHTQEVTEGCRRGKRRIPWCGQSGGGQRRRRGRRKKRRRLTRRIELT
ncbi:hypothetical protein E2C01_003525 [Portunus trituberculatus]|uniref:Uncharacterized protein n=1 Tax=Portunus trituberculatus TaxID=210409 RepID=A0A5B7CQ02_PORTR|nr:hypothetical protein [Portunus trituberculatus]